MGRTGTPIREFGAATAAGTLPVVVIGGGGHGRVILDLLRARGQPVLGVVDRDAGIAGRLPQGIDLLGDDEALDRLSPERVMLANGIGSVGPVGTRRAIFERFVQRGFRFATLCHPGAIVAPDAEIGEGSQVMAGAVIQTGCRIGRNVILNTRASIDHDCDIGDHTHVAPGAVLSGGVRLGVACHIGTGAVIIQNIVIGSEVVVGAGTVALRDIAAGTTFVGKRA